MWQRKQTTQAYAKLIGLHSQSDQKVKRCTTDQVSQRKNEKGELSKPKALDGAPSLITPNLEEQKKKGYLGRNRSGAAHI
jgi:hypothetical protein